MISKAEQQMVLKSQDFGQLNGMFATMVATHKKFDGLNFALLDMSSMSVAIEVATKIADEFKIDFDHGNWTITLGGTAAKKVTIVSGDDLPLAILKSAIIYVRKYL